MGTIKRWLEFNWNWHGAIGGLVLLGLLACDLALFGETVGGYIGIAVIVLVLCCASRSARAGFIADCARRTKAPWSFATHFGIRVCARVGADAQQ
jgi:hypothetical protein